MDQESTIDIPKPVLEWVRKDGAIIIVCLVAVLLCLYSLLVGLNYKEACNTYWNDRLQAKGFFDYGVDNFSMDMKLWGDYEDQDQD